MDREELVAEMADAIFRLRSADRNVKSSDLARAALAVAEPVVREWAATTAHQHGYTLSNLDERNGCFFAADAIRTGGTP